MDDCLGDGVVGVEADGRVELVVDQLLLGAADGHRLHSGRLKSEPHLNMFLLVY